jgi:hypothetical protein
MILLHQENGIKQDVIAIGAFEKEISESLSKLMITSYNDVDVLSVYSDLTNQLLAYKILGKSSLENDPWVQAGFRNRLQMDFNTSFTFIPSKLAHPGAHHPGDLDIAIEYHKQGGSAHYSEGLLKYQASVKEDSVCVYKVLNTYSVFIFTGKNCVFANSFNCSNELELLYFIINAIEVSGLSQEKVSVYLDYSIVRNEKNIEFLKPYFPAVKPLRLEHQDIDPLIPFLPEMLFANQLLSLCAL